MPSLSAPVSWAPRQLSWPVMSAPGSRTAPAAVNPLVEEHVRPPTFIPSATSALPSLSVPVSWAPRQLSWPVMSAPDSRIAPAAVNPSSRNTSTADLQPVGDQRVAVAVSTGQLGAAAGELAGDVCTGQPDRAGRGEPLVKEHIPAGLHRLGVQRIAVAVGAGQLGAAGR